MTLRRLAPAFVLFAVGLAGGLVYQSSSRGNNEPAYVPQPPPTPKPERYAGLSICIQAVPVDPAMESQAKSSLEAALVPVMQDERWKLSRRDRVPPIVHVGCPSEPLVGRPGVRWNASLLHLEGAPYDVEAPSFYHTFVFVMSPEQMHSLLGGLSIRLAPQENERKVTS